MRHAAGSVASRAVVVRRPSSPPGWSPTGSLTSAQLRSSRPFRDWPAGPLPGAAELVAQTRASVATGCFSNTNALHWHGHIAAWPLAGLFDHRFLSFELGLLKPDTAAFAQVADLLGVPAERVLFLDDNAVNVAGAAAAGFQAARASGVDEARQRLAEAAVLGTIP